MLQGDFNKARITENHNSAFSTHRGKKLTSIMQNNRERINSMVDLKIEDALHENLETSSNSGKG